MTEEEARGILAEFQGGAEVAALYGELKRRMGWSGRTLIIGHGTAGFTDDDDAHSEELQRRVRSAADRLVPFLQEMETAGR